MLVIGVLVGVISVIAACSVLTIEHGSVGVTATRTYPPGLGLAAPWRRVRRVPLTEQTLAISGHTALADGITVRFEVTLRFKPADLERWLDLESPREHVAGLVSYLVRDQLGRASSSQLPVRLDLAALARAELARYGIEVTAAELTDVVLPDELVRARDAIARAEADAERNHADATAESRRRLADAETELEVARAWGAAVEREIAMVGLFLEQLDRAGTLSDYLARRRTELGVQARPLRSVS